MDACRQMYECKDNVKFKKGTFIMVPSKGQNLKGQQLRIHTINKGENDISEKKMCITIPINNEKSEILTGLECNKSGVFKSTTYRKSRI